MSETPRAAKIISAVGKSVQPDQWKNRNRYGWFVTVAMLGIYGWSVHFDKPLGLTFWMICLIIVLVMLAPTASQFGKWLAQVAAIRNGTKAND